MFRSITPLPNVLISSLEIIFWVHNATGRHANDMALLAACFVLIYLKYLTFRRSLIALKLLLNQEQRISLG